jgi:hypothetical protein
MLKKILAAALLLPLVALAQNYPSPTFKNVTTNGAITANGTITGTAFSNYLASPPAIGGTAPGTGAFTGLSASGTISGTGFTNYFASPPALGSTTPNTIAGTSYLGNINPTGSSLSGNCLPSGGTQYCINQVVIGANGTHDQLSLATPGSFVNGTQFTHYYGGSSMTGGRQTLYVQSSFTNPSSTSNTNHNYVAGTFFIQADAGDNGTAPSYAGGKGAFFAMNPYVHAYNGATNLLEITGAEFDIAAETGSSMAYKAGLTVAQVAGDAVQGSVYDTAIGISNAVTGLSGWQNGILFGPMNGAFPIASTGCMICSTGSGTVTSGIDFSSLTLTTFLKSNGFAVNGAGTIASNGLNSTGTIAENATNASVQINDTSASNGAQTVYQKNGTTLFTVGSASSTSAFNISRYVSGTATDSPISISNATGAVSMPDGIAGTTTGATASLGNLGNLQTTNASAISLSAGYNTGTSLAVAAGDYMVQCVAQFTPNAATTYSNMQVGVNTSASVANWPNTTIQQWTNTQTGLSQVMSSPWVHEPMTSSGTLYCPLYVNFSTNTMTASTQINVLRIH